MLFANIALLSPVKKLYQYSIPNKFKSIIKPGFRVIIPLQNRKIKGVVISLTTEKEFDSLKNIINIVESFPFYSKEILELSKWMAEYYCSSIGQCLEVCALSIKNADKKTLIKKLFICEKEKLNSFLKKNNKLLWKDIANKVNEFPGKYSRSSISKLFNCSISPVNTLIKKEILLLKDIENENPFLKEVNNEDFFILTDEQKKAFNKIKEILFKKNSLSAYIHGITGSGKTEIYMHIIKEYIENNKQCIVLVPEISLTPQMINRFKKRFGSKVSILHSKLSENQRNMEWNKILKKEALIAIGPRSALFAPFPDLGLIIIDEEHENTYKQSDRVRYHTVDTALKRAEICNAKVIMGSATPSLEQYYYALNNKTLVELNNRATIGVLPEVIIVDMKEELKNGNNKMFSKILEDKLKKAKSNSEQAILFLNKRGFSSFVMCRSCNYVMKCNECSVSLTYHFNENILKCHYCDKTVVPPKICPACQSKYIRYFGVGTEKVENEFNRNFRELSAIRMDSDTTKTKFSHNNILNDFINKKFDVLIGTQMVAKGLDIPNITVVGVITADTTLNLPDFRSTERTFQLITQVAGRAGRAEKPGIVIVQTYDPENEAILTSSKHDYKSFYNYEIEIRKELNFPPFSHFIRVIFSSLDRDEAKKATTNFKKKFENVSLDDTFEIMGGCPCPIERVRKRYRWHILFKCNDMKFLRDKINNSFKNFKLSSKVRKIIDVDPVSML